MSEISGETIFIDGAKIEVCANNYTFVWEKAVAKNQVKLADLIAEGEELYGIKIVHGETVKMKHVRKLRRKFYAMKQEENIVFFHGIGKKKSPRMDVFWKEGDTKAKNITKAMSEQYGWNINTTYTLLKPLYLLFIVPLLLCM